MGGPRNVSISPPQIKAAACAIRGLILQGFALDLFFTQHFEFMLPCWMAINIAMATRRANSTLLSRVSFSSDCVLILCRRERYQIWHLRITSRFRKGLKEKQSVGG
jgi:hypothetical protein